MDKWILKKHPYICCLYIYEIHFRSKDKHIHSEGMKKDIPCKWKQRGSWCNNTYIWNIL